MAAVIIALILSGYFVYRWRRKKKYGGKNWAPYQIEEGDDINKLAGKFNINWEILAKTNNIKAPYFLETGNTILVPPLPGEAPAEIKLAETVSSPPPADSAPPAVPISAEPTFESLFAPAGLSGSPKEEVIKEEGETARGNSLEKFIPGKKIVSIIAVSVVFTALIGIIIWLVGENKKCKRIDASLSIASIGGKNNSENAVAPEKVEQEGSKTEEQKNTETEEQKSPGTIKDITPAELDIKVLNGGAAPGMAGKIDEFLVGKGYSKSVADNAAERDKIGVSVFYQDDKFKEEADKIVELLKEQNLKASAKKGSLDEEKSGEIVVMLGK